MTRPRLEALETRTLMAGINYGVGFDPTFADEGVAVVDRTGGVVGDARLAVDDAIYFEFLDGQARYVAKLNALGRPDTSWGINGIVRVAGKDVQQLAYDKRTGSLYVGGTTDLNNNNTPQSLYVLRLTSNGTRDTTFGISGFATYTPQQGSADSYTRISCDQLVALPGRSVLVAMNRSLSTQADDFYFTTTTRQDVSLMKLRANGQRDPAFGRRGVTTVLSGKRVSETSDFVTNLTVDETALADLRPLDDGGFRVVLTRSTGTRIAERSSDDGSGLSGKIAIKSRVISASGIEDTGEAFSWTISVSGDQDGRRVAPGFIGADANDDVTAIFSYPGGGETFRYALTPGERPVATPLDVTGVAELTEVIRNRRGYYFVADDFGRVARLKGDFSRDITFGSRGVAIADKRYPDGLFADPDNRVLATNARYEYELMRFL